MQSTNVNRSRFIHAKKNTIIFLSWLRMSWVNIKRSTQPPIIAADSSASFATLSCSELNEGGAIEWRVIMLLILIPENKYFFLELCGKLCPAIQSTCSISILKSESIIPQLRLVSLNASVEVFYLIFLIFCGSFSVFSSNPTSPHPNSCRATLVPQQCASIFDDHIDTSCKGRKENSAPRLQITTQSWRHSGMKTMALL